MIDIHLTFGLVILPPLITLTQVVVGAAAGYIAANFLAEQATTLQAGIEQTQVRVPGDSTSGTAWVRQGNPNSEVDDRSYRPSSDMGSVRYWRAFIVPFPEGFESSDINWNYEFSRNQDFNPNDEYFYSGSHNSLELLEWHDAITGAIINLPLPGSGELPVSDLVLSATIEATVPATINDLNNTAKDVKNQLDRIAGDVTNIRNNYVTNQTFNEFVTNITEVIEVDLSPVINLLYQLDAAMRTFLSAEFFGINVELGTIQDQAALIAEQSRIRDETIRGLIEALEFPEPENIEDIRARLEQILSVSQDTNGDLQLAAGVISTIADLATQVLTDTTEIKNKVKECTPEDEEEEKEDCCEEVLEILERLKAVNESNYVWHENCEAEEPQVLEMGGQAFGGILSSIREVLNRLNEVNRNLCNIDAIAAVPEGWPMRVENNRAQLVVLLDINEDGKWIKQNRQVTIPHYGGAQTLPEISYTTGNFYAMLVLSDNSKIKVYANSEGAARGVVEQLGSMVKGGFMQGSYVTTGQIRRPIKSVAVRSRAAKFYESGHAPGRSPLWVVRRPRE